MLNDVEIGGEYEAPLFEEMGDFQEETGFIPNTPSHDGLTPGFY